MKRSILLSLSILVSVLTFSQTTATDFSVDDCEGNFHNLFTELDEGKVIVITWVMPCASCIGPALASYQEVQSYAVSHPGQVLYYMADDYANTPCSTLKSWAGNNAMVNVDAFFSNSAVNMSDYGAPGMPKVVVVGCSEHKVYFNKNFTASGIGEAIDEALLDCNAINTAVDEYSDGNFNVNLFPNPAQDNITITYDINESAAVRIDIVNIMGKNVSTISNSFQNAGAIEFQFDTNNLNDGLYFLRIQSKKDIQVVKFSVAH